VGYTSNLAQNLIFYDEPDLGVPREINFYAEPLFPSRTIKNKLEWKILKEVI